MSQYVPFVVIGLSTGAIYGLAAVGLVLTYKTSGVFNFAYGAVAAVAAYIFMELHFEHGLAWPPALVVTVVGYGVVSGLALSRVARWLSHVAPAFVVVATVGLLIAVQTAIELVAGAESRPFPEFLPTTLVEIFGVNVSYAEILKFSGAIVVTGALYAFLQTRRLGMAMRAVVDDPNLLGLGGTDPERVRTHSWIIGSTFAALTGILIAPLLGLDSVLLTLLIVQAFGAAAIGRFSNLPLTFVGGLVVGVLAAVATPLVTGRLALGGLPAAVPFLVLFGMLLVLRSRDVPEEGQGRASIGRGGTPLGPHMKRAAAVGLALALAVPLFAGVHQASFTNGAIYMVVFLSLALLLLTSGQVSLCHAGFAAVGAVAMGHLTVGAGLPWPVALVLAGALTVPVGAVIAIPAIRLAGVYLALATFAFGILLERIFYRTPLMFTELGVRAASRPEFASSDTVFYYVILAVLLGSAGLVYTVTRTRLGRLLRAMGQSPVALATTGASVKVTLVLVFCLSAFLAGVGGALFASQAGAIGPQGFTAFTSLTWFAVLGITASAFRGVIPPAIAAALALTLIPAYIMSYVLPDVPYVWFTFFFGVTAVVLVIQGDPLPKLQHLGHLIHHLAAGSADRATRSPVRERQLVPGTRNGQVRSSDNLVKSKEFSR